MFRVWVLAFSGDSILNLYFFFGTVYLINLSEISDQALPFALAADRTEVRQALGS